MIANKEQTFTRCALGKHDDSSIDLRRLEF
jgi:hypothetical protein